MSQYLIVYNNTQGFDLGRIHEVVTTIPIITDWWHYLPNTYIVSSVGTAKNIADVIQSHFQGLLFFVVKIDLQDTNGVLNKDAWEWVSDKNKSVIKVRPVSSVLPSLPPISPSLLPSPMTPDRFKMIMEILKKRSETG